MQLESIISNIISKLSIVKGASAFVLTTTLLKVDFIASFFNFSDDKVYQYTSVFCLSYLFVHGAWKIKDHAQSKHQEKKNAESKKKNQIQKVKDALKIYENLNQNEKEIIDSAIYYKDYVYESYDKSVILNLHVKGLGTEYKFDSSIIFNTGTFLIIEQVKGAEIRAAYEAEEEEEEYAA